MRIKGIIFARPSFIKGNNFGIKLSRRYIVAAAAVKSAVRINLLLEGSLLKFKSKLLSSFLPI
jgi:hypothetical protein